MPNLHPFMQEVKKVELVWDEAALLKAIGSASSAEAGLAAAVTLRALHPCML